MAEYTKDEIRKIEDKWRREWTKREVYKACEDTTRPKYYVLDMFPYPSGAGLHVGHPLGFIASDIVARFKRITGFSVLHPMGFDSFGLPAEQYAIATGQHPAITTAQNIDTFKKQLGRMGLSFDWSREVQTSDPNYYKWTQWIFMQLFNAWYNKKTGTEKIDTLIAAFTKDGNKHVVAVCDENTPVFTASEWSGYDEKQREGVLQKYRIAYQSETMVNWCAALGTVLSNDEVKDGVSERGGYPVERIKMLQWSMRITAYADRLLAGLDTIDWPEPLKEMQRNWIGRSEGARIAFKIKDFDKELVVFTTRPETIFGVDFMVIAPELDLVKEITSQQQKQEVEKYLKYVESRSEVDRMAEVKKITGCFTGAYVVHPFTGKNIPIWISEYVLAGYGTGAIMAVPCGDERDHKFAKHFNLPVTNIIGALYNGIDANATYDAVLENSDFLNGKPMKDAVPLLLTELEKRGIGERKINYRMRDAIFGRQRYWGEPFPVYFKDTLPKLVDVKDLPVTLPPIDEYKPTASGEPPLARAKDWRYRENGGDNPLPFELTTMPGWAGSSWYWFRYMDPHNTGEFASRKSIDYWKDVDLYIGGAEHATGHLLYARFWCKALKDLGFVESEEPFKKLINQGHIQGVSKFVYRLLKSSHYAGTPSDQPLITTDNFPPVFISKSLKEKLEKGTATLDELTLITTKEIELNNRFKSENEKGGISFNQKMFNQLHVDISLVENDELNIEDFKLWRQEYNKAEFITEADGKYICGSEVEKMSKSKYNVVNPDDIIEKYGSDTLRLYEMFLGPLEQSKPWNTNGIDGVYKFLRKFWNLCHTETGIWNVADAEPTRPELKALHKTLKKVEHDISNFSFNTSVSEFMICVNELTALKCNKRAILEPLVIALSPFAPHVAEELWEKLGHSDTILKATFVKSDEQYLKENAFDYPISINGKVRTTMNFALDMPKEDIEKLVLASETVLKWSEGKPPKKVIVVPGRIVNVVL